MNAEILSIGTELLVGSIVNTNARFLSQALAESSVDVFRQTSVGDNVGRIVEALREAFRRSDAVLTSGGLGPTADDVTMEAVGRFLGSPLSFHSPTRRHVARRLRSRGYAFDPISERQCRLPKVFRVFQNPVGTAPGVLHEFAFEGRKKWLVVLPGPPRELEPLFREILPHLLRRAGAKRGHFVVRTVRLAGLVEVEVAKKVPALLRSKPPLTVGIYAKPGEVELKIMSKAASLASARRRAARAERVIRRKFGAHVYGADAETLSSALGALLKKKKATLALAESCTGGLVGHLVSDTAGSSDYFVGGVTCYSNRIKRKFLGVPSEILEAHGAVSPQTAWLMARGARQAFGAAYAIGVTGIAGPSGGTKKKPVGLVYVSISGPKGTIVYENRFYGTRAEVKSRAANRSLDLLRRAFLSGF